MNSADIPASDFKYVKIGTRRVLVFEPWFDQRLWHGFCGVKISEGKKERRWFTEGESCTSLLIKDLLLPFQKHTDNLIFFDNFSGIDMEKSPADGILSDVRSLETGVNLGVLTADCVPVLMKSGTLIGAVHAGWRGVLSGIVGKAVGLMREKSGGADVTLIIGPYAGGAGYQIGQEVADLFSELGGVSFQEGSIFLDLGKAIYQNLIQSIGESGWKIYESGICTLVDKEYHSWRREKEVAGRNLSFIGSTTSDAEFFHIP